MHPFKIVYVLIDEWKNGAKSPPRDYYLNAESFAAAESIADTQLTDAGTGQKPQIMIIAALDAMDPQDGRIYTTP